MIWGIISLILLLVVIGLTIWLLIRQSGSCPTGKKLNEACTNTNECNAGLVCSSGSGTDVRTTTGASADTTRICKVAFGGVCSASSDCAFGQVCENGICTIALGKNGQGCPCQVGFTCVNEVCRAIVGQACNENSDCASGMCMNNVCVSNSNNSHCSSGSYTDCYTDSHTRSNSLLTDSYTDSRTRSTDGTYTYVSGTYTYTDSSGGTRSPTVSSDTRHSKSSSYSSEDCSSNTECAKDSYSSHSDTFDSSKYSSDCSPRHHRKRYIKQGVYVTTPANVDSTLFTAIEKPIIDIAKFGSGFLLLLSNGNLVMNTGMVNTQMMSNRKIHRIVRFGTEIVGMDRHGNLYSQNKEGSNKTYWSWEKLRNYPCNAMFIDSTNTYNNLEVLTTDDKAFVYTFNASTWKEGNSISKRSQKDSRYYGKDLNRYIDVNQRTQTGKTNDGIKYKHIKAAGFYNTGANGGDLVQVLIEDTFTHVRIIENKAYFLFEQNC